MKQLSGLKNALYMAGAAFMVVGALLFMWLRPVACVVYLAGVLLFSAMQLSAAYEGDNLTLRRLRRQQLFGLFCFLVSAIMMAMFVWDLRHGSFVFRYVHNNEWVILLAIGALVQLYTAFRIPAELEKELSKRL